MRKIAIFTILILLLVALVMFLIKTFPDTLHNDQNIIGLVTTLIVLLSLFARIARSSNANLFNSVKQLAVWIFIAIAILAGYSYQSDLKSFSNRLLANLIPGYGETNKTSNSVVYYARNGGHFIINGIINDASAITFLFDTGASMVALTPQDATKIGIDIKSLNYNLPINTANGVNWGARVTLDKVQIGKIIEHNVEATVASGGLDISLLGMSFLRKLKQFDIHDNKLTLVK